MPRRRVPKKRAIFKDPIFGSEVVGAYINHIMRDGKKSIAIKIITRALNLVKESFIQDNRIEDETFKSVVESKRALLNLADNEPLPQEKIGLVVLYRAIDKTKPHVEVRSNRIGGDTRQVPMAVTYEKGQRLARTYIQKAAEARRSSTTFKPGDLAMAKLLALEWMDAYDGKGGAVKMCADVYRMAKANQVYVHNRSPINQDALPL